ncbi:hypothetical protein C8J57DRAFT_1434228 [Mycena rebaudengoi]|nr:hypothetical protein C8J57DRAFT_1434228 [Mycena rebaudengoi]
MIRANKVPVPQLTIFSAEHHEIFDSHEFETRGSEDISVPRPQKYSSNLKPLGVAVRGSVNLAACLAEVRNGTWGLTGGTDNHGHPVFDSHRRPHYLRVLQRRMWVCPGTLQWNLFSQRFCAWLLPYLALVSQLPFGASKIDNLMSVLLTVGSPTLAAYSLALTVLNGRWITRRFSGISYPNAKNAVKILSNLQQSSLEVNTNGSLLASLVVLHKNDGFWEELIGWVNYGNTWSISAVASILWVVIAYACPVVDSFTGLHLIDANDNGLAVGSIFLWLLPIVVGWLQIGSECDAERVHQAMEKANKIAYVASLDGDPVLVSELSNKRAMYLRKGAGEIRRDERRTPPIYNYARFFPWTFAVEHVYYAFREASERSHNIFPHPRSRWGSGIVSRFLLAAFVALCLTWGTTAYRSERVSLQVASTRLAGGLSIILRRLGKILATINVIWIVLACLFQFGGFFDSCWCDSSVFYLGAKSAYNVVDISPDDAASLNVPWIAAALASGCAMFFIGFVNV